MPVPLERLGSSPCPMVVARTGAEATGRDLPTTARPSIIRSMTCCRDSGGALANALPRSSGSRCSALAAAAYGRQGATSRPGRTRSARRFVVEHRAEAASAHQLVHVAGRHVVFDHHGQQHGLACRYRDRAPKAPAHRCGVDAEERGRGVRAGLEAKALEGGSVLLRRHAGIMPERSFCARTASGSGRLAAPGLCALACRPRPAECAQGAMRPCIPCFCLQKQGPDRQPSP